MNTFNEAKTPFLTTLFVLALLFIFTRLFGPILFAVNSVQTTKSDLFQVSGIGKVSAAPDSALVNFGVTKTANTIADAQNQTNSLISSITDALSKEGIDSKNIKTTAYDVSPNYNFNNGGNQTITGYTVTQTIQLTIQPIDKVNNTLDILTANGANIINQVSFTFSDNKKKELEDEARQLAVTDAKQKATSLANASGIHLGRVINVTEDTTPQPLPIMPMLAQKEGSAVSSTPTQVTSGENSISLSVTLSYETY